MLSAEISEYYMKLIRKTIAGRHIVSEKQLQSIIYSRNRDRICRAYAQMKEKGIQCLSIVDTHYPDMLKSLHDPPIVLYFLGSIPARKSG